MGQTRIYDAAHALHLLRWSVLTRETVLCNEHSARGSAKLQHSCCWCAHVQQHMAPSNRQCRRRSATCMTCTALHAVPHVHPQLSAERSPLTLSNGFVASVFFCSRVRGSRLAEERRPYKRSTTAVLPTWKSVVREPRFQNGTSTGARSLVLKPLQHCK